MILNELAKKHDKWLSMAKVISKDNAEDIVQEMYIKALGVNKEVDDWYIFRIMKNIFIDEKRKQKEFCQPEFNCTVFEDIDIEYFLKKEQNVKTIETALKKLKPYEKKIILLSYEEGLREFSRNSEISMSTIQKIRTKFKNIIWQEEKKQEGLAI